MLHSMAVDYPKTGIPAELTPELRTMEYPDFMENFKKPMRKSEKVRLV
jgi:RNA-dependent RNA polymerase